jgi:hypothetical protein
MRSLGRSLGILEEKKMMCFTQIQDFIHFLRGFSGFLPGTRTFASSVQGTAHAQRRPRRLEQDLLPFSLVYDRRSESSEDRKTARCIAYTLFQFINGRAQPRQKNRSLREERYGGEGAQAPGVYWLIWILALCVDFFQRHRVKTKVDRR